MVTKIQISFLLILVCISLSSCKDTITVNQKFRDGNILISQNQKFALGFFTPGHSKNRYLGIWFNNIAEKTVIWVANRNKPINKSSSAIISFNKQGNLVLCGNRGKNLLWSTNVSEFKGVDDNLSAQLLGTGNLVLVRGGKLLWESFDHPTNTLISGMKQGINFLSGTDWFLTSWRSADDPGTGDYTCKLNPNGSPQFFIYNGTKKICRSDPWPWKKMNLIYNYSCVRNEQKIYCSFATDDDHVVPRVVLDDSGILKWLIWLKNYNQWKEYWLTTGKRCDFYGLCGPNSRCDSTQLDNFECTCLPGYEPKFLKDWNLRDGSSGCVRKRLNSSSFCEHGEGFVKVPKVKLPDTSTAVWIDSGISSSRLECERKCRGNCACSAYASVHISDNETGCLTWSTDLIDTISVLHDSGKDLYVRVDALELAERAKGSSSIFKKKGVLSVLIISIISAWFSLITIFAYFWSRMKKKKSTMKNNTKKRIVHPVSGSKYDNDTTATMNEIEGGSKSHQNLVFLKLKIIRAATDNFSPSNIIGQGGFGTVYKGTLADGQEVAVKRLSPNSRQGIEEFRNEATLIAKLQHRNLVRLIGCCIQRTEQILKYEYMYNKSLNSFLFDQTRKSILDWVKRFNIVVGIARGILYLHQDSRLRIIHRDLKTSNILLDAEMNPKISDFGTARLLEVDKTQEKTNRIVGTYGYMSPEYAVFGEFSVKSDVFSYGVILLEIVSGKKNNNFSQEDSSLSLIGRAWKLWNEGGAMEIVDSSLIESCDHDQVLRCIQVGLLCVQENVADRPTMLEILLMLKSENNILPSPKQPAFVYRETSRDTKFLAAEEASFSTNEMTISEVRTR